jgi:hypothetical protein
LAVAADGRLRAGLAFYGVQLTKHTKALREAMIAKPARATFAGGA